jgi:hypothetical protein
MKTDNGPPQALAKLNITPLPRTTAYKNLPQSIA